MSGHPPTYRPLCTTCTCVIQVSESCAFACALHKFACKTDHASFSMPSNTIKMAPYPHGRYVVVSSLLIIAGIVNKIYFKFIKVPDETFVTTVNVDTTTT